MPWKHESSGTLPQEEETPLKGKEERQQNYKSTSLLAMVNHTVIFDTTLTVLTPKMLSSYSIYRN